MSAQHRPIDPDGLLEYSVVYSDRALNHMSPRFQAVMCDLSATLKDLYAAHAIAIIPGSGTFGMEAVARQLATDKKCLVLRNGWFSYRWSQILARGRIPAAEVVCKARPASDHANAPFVPTPIDALVDTIAAQRPDVVFAPHVETSAGMILPDAYLRRVGEATRAVGGLFVLDCIASGALWVDMKASLVDVLITAPQKGWTGPPCAAVVLMSERAHAQVTSSESTSFACDLGKWSQIMARYEAGGHAYHATMPTDGLRAFRDVVLESKAHGFAQLKAAQRELGEQVRAICARRWQSVATAQFAAPTVVVCYTDDPEVHSGAAFARNGLQIAAGVPLRCDEPDGFQTFRVGLFGLDKLLHIERTVRRFHDAVIG